MKKIKALIFVTLIFASFGFINKSHAATSIRYNWQIPSVWTKGGSPYIISFDAIARKRITIEPGVVVKFTPSGGLYAPYGASIKGTAEEKIYFTSIKDDSVGGDTNNDGDRTKPNKGDAHELSFSDNYDLEIENVKISYMNWGLSVSRYTSGYGYLPGNVTIKDIEVSDCFRGISIGNAYPVIENSLIINNSIGIKAYNDLQFYKFARINNNRIFNNIIGVSTEIKYFNHCPIDRELCFDFRNNWWGDKNGPYYKATYNSLEKDNINTLGNAVEGNGVSFSPWLGKDPTIPDLGCQENCFSNVMFLPGIKASRLYKKDLLGGEDKLWVPNFFGNDLEDLALDENGESINNVYTRDALDEVAVPLVGGNIYKSFLQKLANLKENGIINDYESFAYDWRQNVEDIAKNGTPYEGATKSAVDDIVKLAQSSKSEKVTIIAHSNGGLLAKAIMLELEEKGLVGKVDKIVMVGTPQMGTPLATLSLLYGYDESALLETLISREDSRNLAENMPGVYGLLPSNEYFNRIENPFITFASENTRYKKYADAYGEHISDSQEFFDFLSGKEGREKPDSGELEKENNLNENLLAQAKEMHERLDNWIPPEGVKVIQIAGWGLDTVRGVKYTEKEKFDCYMADSKIPSCIGMGEYEPIYEPEFTVDGDEVVVTPSALMMSGNENVERYWVDLNAHNDAWSNFDRIHKDILESNALIKFIDQVIREDYYKEFEYISNIKPVNNDVKKSLRMSLYSPLDIHLYDEKGNHTGPKKILIDGKEKTVFEEGILNSYYYQFGDRKYVGFQENQNIKVIMDGYALGSYTLKLEEVQIGSDGETIISKKEFLNLPTTENTKAEFNVPVLGLSEMGNLEADMDGDGKNEYELNGKEGEKIELPVTLKMITGNIDHLAKLGFIKNEKTQEFLQIKVKELMHIEDMVEKMDKKDNNNPKENQLELFNKKTGDLVGFIEGKLSDDMTQIAQDILIKDLKSVKIE